MGEVIDRIIKFKRGSIWWHDFQYNCIDSHVILGKHPCVVVSNDRLNATSGSVMVVPLTSVINDKYLDVYNVRITSFNEKDSAAICSQIKTVDTRDLDNYQGILPKQDMDKIDRYIRYHLGMGDERYANETPKVVEEKHDKNSEIQVMKEEKHKWKDIDPDAFLGLYEEGGALAIMEKYNLNDKQQVYAVVHSFRKRLAMK